MKDTNKLIELCKEIFIPPAVDEAINILDKATADEILLFVGYYNSNAHNSCTMLLDKIKDRLVSCNMIKQNVHDHFGKGHV